jgi:hypothetical protein
MRPLEFFFLVVGPFLLFGYALFRLYFSNRFTVKPNNIERVVVQNAATGRLKVLGPGTHFLGPGWKELTKIMLNREPVSVSDEEVRSADGNRLEVEYRFDMIAGRPFHPVTGQIGLYDPGPPPTFTPISADDRSAVRDREVILAVTAINFEQREQRIREVVRAALEQEVGLYSADLLTVPQEIAQAARTAGQPLPQIPRVATPGGIAPVDIDNAAVLYRQLAQCVAENANAGLLHVGINIIDFRIMNLRYKDPKLQEALESKKRLAKLKDAALQLTGRDGITLREGLAAGTDQYGTVVLGEAGRDAADDIGFGLANFGRGTRRRRRRGP